MEKWCEIELLTGQIRFLKQGTGGQNRYGYLYVHTLHLGTSESKSRIRQVLESQEGYEELSTAGLRAIWCRLQSGLNREDFCEETGVSMYVCRNLEDSDRFHVTPELARKVGAFYGKPASDFENDYSRFLNGGQGRQLRELRAKLGMDQWEFAREFGVNFARLVRWEDEELVMSYPSWEKLFRDTI